MRDEDVAPFVVFVLALAVVIVVSFIVAVSGG